MAVKAKLEINPDGGFSIVIEEDGSGDLNRIMGELCKKHREARGRDGSPRRRWGWQRASGARGRDGCPGGRGT